MQTKLMVSVGELKRMLKVAKAAVKATRGVVKNESTLCYTLEAEPNGMAKLVAVRPTLSEKQYYPTHSALLEKTPEENLHVTAFCTGGGWRVVSAVTGQPVFDKLIATGNELVSMINGANLVLTNKDSLIPSLRAQFRN